ncbi:lysozyme 3 [Saccostrea echinata]|uniref:lysozyme 3 n=1 Tax=Saccostrea echinata TaxID=191078 RepID=UPI002A823201|nr:lysozyme 3 [Saccostrea echinata]
MDSKTLLCGIALLVGVVYGSDAPCTNSGGHCQDDHLACHNGHYQSGMCSGGTHRRCCLTSASHTGSFSSGIVSQHCLQCICNVESGCKAIGCHFDVNSDSCGYFQIKEGYWHDCGSPGSSWRSCANDLACASKCVQAYMSRYIGFSGCSHSCESYARIHNGGPAGCRHSNTAGYWSHVHAQGCNHNS